VLHLRISDTAIGARSCPGGLIRYQLIISLEEMTDLMDQKNFRAICLSEQMFNLGTVGSIEVRKDQLFDRRTSLLLFPLVSTLGHLLILFQRVLKESPRI